MAVLVFIMRKRTSVKCGWSVVFVHPENASGP